MFRCLDHFEGEHGEEGGETSARRARELKRAMKFCVHVRAQLQSFFMCSELRQQFWKLTSLAVIIFTRLRRDNEDEIRVSPRETLHSKQARDEPVKLRRAFSNFVTT